MISIFFKFTPILPELFLACVGLISLMIGSFQQNIAEKQLKVAIFISRLTIVGFVLAILLVCTSNIGISGDGIIVSMNGLYLTDGYGGFFKILILLAAIFVLTMSTIYMKIHDLFRFEYPILMLFAVLGMMIMVSSGNLMSLYLGLELQSLSLYIMTAFSRDSLRSTEAGLKYFVLGALASGMLLYGISMIYGVTGTTDFAILAKHFTHLGEQNNSTVAMIGLVFMLSGLAFKISAVPFHMWTPDVYEGAPTPVTAFLALAPKIAAMGLILRLMIGPFGDLIIHWRPIMTFIALGSMLLGAFAAIAQTNIKRMMAYSSIGHMGYALIGLVAGTEEGVRGVLIYITIYLFMNAGAFACILSMRRGERMVDKIQDLAGLGKQRPMMAVAMAIFMFSLAGIPPMAGFFGKFYIFIAAIHAQLYGLAIIGVLASVVGSFYYLRVIKVMYFDEPIESFDKYLGVELAGVMLVSGIIILFFWIYPTPMLSEVATAAASLFAG